MNRIFFKSVGIVHYDRVVKADVREPLIYGALLVALALVRIVFNLKR